jgi:hypothetical protein
VKSVESQETFRRNNASIFSVKADGKQSSAFKLVSCPPYSSTLKMEAMFPQNVG